MSATVSDFHEVSLFLTSGSARQCEPMTCGIPWPRGLLSDPAQLSLIDASGRAVPLQTRVLERWSDDSVRWLLLDWQPTIAASGTACYRLRPGEAAVQATRMRVTASPERIRIDTGACGFEVHQHGEALLTCGQARAVLRTEDERGTVLRAIIDRLWIEESGLLRCRVCLEGRWTSPSSQRVLDLFAEIDFFAGLGTVRLRSTVRNPRAAGHPGGNWDLGGAGSMYLRDVSVALSHPQNGEFLISAEQGQPLTSLPGPVELYQDSSGGENWQSSNHVNRHRQVPNRFRGYHLRYQTGETEGLRATPVVVQRSPTGQMGVAVPAFWQNFPGAVEARDTTLTVRLFPHQYADVHELQGGEQKTRVVYLAFAADTVTELPLDWCRSPALAHASPEWYSQAGAVPYLLPRSEDPDPGYARLVESALEGEHNFDRKREVIDEYGWRHFGDIYGDHEAVFHKGPTPLVSHFNNQYDPIAGFACQLFRTGDPRWWRHMDELAWHVIDIDIYHTEQDKSAYNHGLFWHTVHYIDADTATHRTYPKAGRAGGGGPANEQNYATGLMLHHFLTGSRASRQTAIDLARWVVDMDDGSKTVFRWLAGGDTGLASKSRTPEYHGPGRGSGNSLSVLVDGHRLTGEQVFLDKAEQIIRRCIHPADHVPARNLLDAENRWFYTMFLQALGKYLDHKAERGQVDFMYAYARASLLHYARWMAEHEYPYLEKPEILEYPTETWAAQDMRKSEIFWYAWLHAQDGERERFRDRARFFYTYSVRKLEEMPTRQLCRPVVLLLSHGLRQAWFEQNPQARAPAPCETVQDFGQPTVFEPQKVRAIRRFKRMAAAALAAGVFGVLFLAWLVWRAFA